MNFHYLKNYRMFVYNLRYFLPNLIHHLHNLHKTLFNLRLLKEQQSILKLSHYYIRKKRIHRATLAFAYTICLLVQLVITREYSSCANVFNHYFKDRPFKAYMDVLGLSP